MRRVSHAQKIVLSLLQYQVVDCRNVEKYVTMACRSYEKEEVSQSKGL
jgi:hypothetical protein